MKLLQHRRWVVAALVVLGVAVAWTLVGSIGERSAADWIEVGRGDLLLEVEVEGTLRAVETESVGPPNVSSMWDFKISFMAPEGGEVKEGEVILGFDASTLQQQLQEQTAESQEARKQIEKTFKESALNEKKDRLRLEEARARLRKAQLKVDVPESIEKGNVLAASRYDLELAKREIAYLERRIEASQESARAALAALQNQAQRAENRVAEIRQAIEAMNVKAPRAGTVVYTTDWNDEKKKVGDSAWRGWSVIELPDLKRMAANGQVDEADAGRVAEGQAVRLRLDAHPDVEFRGRVSAIKRTVEQKSWRIPLKVVRMDITLDETDPTRMRPGMRFRGEVETQRIADVVKIPLEAVLTERDGTFVLRKGVFGTDRVRVELGQRNEDEVIVESGLRPGATIARDAIAASREEAS